MNEYIELLEFTIQRYQQRVHELMEWVNDVERKASTLIAANGVVIALSASLINVLILLYQHASLLTTCFRTSVLILTGVVYLIYVIQLVFFMLSVYYAYRGHRVESYVMPNISYLYNECRKEIRMSKKDILMQEVSELVNSKDKISKTLNQKSAYVKKSQCTFVSGCVILSIMLFALILVIVIGGFSVSECFLSL